MKRVRINAGKVGLVFRKGNYRKVLSSGTHWMWFTNRVFVFNMAKEFLAPIAIELLLKDTELEAMLEIIEVKDGNIALRFENGNFKDVLTAGRYFFWKGLIDHSYVMADLNKIYITEQIDKTTLSTYKVNQYVRTFEVATYEKAVLIIDDKYEKTLGPGVYRFWKNSISIKVAKADLRMQQLEIAGQELLTKDKAAIRMSLYAQYKVVAIEKALLSNKDYEKQLYVALQLVLRAYIGGYTLDELLEQKEGIGNAVLETVQKDIAKLGVSLLSIGIRDVILTGEMKDIMNQVLVAQKRAQANIITRREETASTRSLLNTAKLMEENEMLFKLKEMEYVEKIADKIGEITVAGNGGMVKQLKEIFSVNK